MSLVFLRKFKYGHENLFELLLRTREFTFKPEKVKQFIQGERGKEGGGRGWGLTACGCYSFCFCFGVCLEKLAHL